MALYRKPFQEIQEALVLFDSPLKAELDSLSNNDAIYSDIVLVNNPQLERIQHYFSHSDEGYTIKLICFPHGSEGRKPLSTAQSFDSWEALVIFCWLNICVEVPGGGF